MSVDTAVEILISICNAIFLFVYFINFLFFCMKLWECEKLELLFLKPRED